MKALACLLLLGAPGLPGSPVSDGEADDPPPREAVAGLDGFEVVSRVVYASQPDHPENLRATYAFPDRARWTRYREGGNPANRMVEYRLGERAWRLPPMQITSSELAGGERDALLRQMELRRAVLFWPDGFSWESGDPDGGDGGAPAVTTLGTLGKLEAELAPRGEEKGERGNRRSAPLWVRAVDGEGREVERLLVHGWREAAGRRVPARLELVAGGRTIWRETVQRFTPSYHADLAFLPPDRRVADGAGVRSLDLVPMTILRVPVSEGEASWDERLREARALMERTATELPAELALDPHVTFALANDGSPKACLLRLARPPAQPPEGWVELPPRPGLMTMLFSPDAIGPVSVGRLVDAAPAGTVAGEPYLRIYEGPTATSYQLVLPLEAER